jgi:hypothetical protein
MTRRDLANPHRPNHRKAAFVVFDVVAALVIIGILLAALAWLVVSYDKAGDCMMARYRAQLAAETCLERLRAGLPPPKDADGMQYTVERQPGQGPWAGLTRVTVATTVNARHQRTARFTLTAYLREAAP